MLHPLLLRWFRMNDCNLCYHFLTNLLFSNMMSTSALSRRVNKCAIVYPTDFGWARVHPMVSRSNVNETLSLQYAGDGVPPACIYNNAEDMIQGKLFQKLKDSACRLKKLVKDMIQGKFCQKLKDAACLLKKLELYTPWSNAAERKIKEKKKLIVCCCSPEHQSTCGMTA